MGAIGVYQLAGEPKNALECAKDIALIYPSTEYASRANDLIATLPKILPPDDPEIQDGRSPTSRKAVSKSTNQREKP